MTLPTWRLEGYTEKTKFSSQGDPSTGRGGEPSRTRPCCNGQTSRRAATQRIQTESESPGDFLRQVVSDEVQRYKLWCILLGCSDFNFSPTSGISIKPLKVKLLAGEQKATKFIWGVSQELTPAKSSCKGAFHDMHHLNVLFLWLDPNKSIAVWLPYKGDFWTWLKKAVSCWDPGAGLELCSQTS